jgi:TRAP-type C4-dicarboxylate transport system permease small subunit
MEVNMGEKARKWLKDNHLAADFTGCDTGGKRFGEVLLVINHWAHKVILYISEIALALMLVTVFMTVVLRYVFSTGIGWAEEFPRLMVTLFAFLACAIGVRDHMHIGVNIIYNRFKPNGKIRKALDVASDVCVLVCGVFLFYYGGKYMLKLANLPGTLPMTGWPTFIQYIPAPLAGFLMTFDSILFLTGVLKSDDLLYSEKEIDYAQIVKDQEAKGEAR